MRVCVCVHAHSEKHVDINTRRQRRDLTAVCVYGAVYLFMCTPEASTVTTVVFIISHTYPSTADNKQRQTPAEEEE